jgi:hypothetical protein
VIYPPLEMVPVSADRDVTAVLKLRTRHEHARLSAWSISHLTVSFCVARKGPIARGPLVARGSLSNETGHPPSLHSLRLFKSAAASSFGRSDFFSLSLSLAWERGFCTAVAN